MDYAEMKRGYLRGWQTWNVRSVLSHVHMPDGLALNIALKEYRDGGYLKETLIGRFANPNEPDATETVLPGLHTADSSYTALEVRWRGLAIEVESTVEGDDLLLLVTPKASQPRPAMLVLETGYLWGRAGYTEKLGDSIQAHAASGDVAVCCTGKPMTDANIPVQAAYLSVALDGAVGFSTGRQRTLAEISARVQVAQAEAKRRSAAFGALDGMYEAAECTLAWDTIYDAVHDRVISPVSRLWSIRSGGYVLFCWDNFFAGLIAGLSSKELAYSNLIGILNERTPQGFVPNFAYATGQCSADRSQPPVGSTMLLEVYRKFRDKWIVEEMYPALLRWNEWFVENRMNASGALCWGSNEIPVQYGNRWEVDGVHSTYGAALESGLDNSPMYDDVPFDAERNRLALEDVGLTGLFVMDCLSLIELAREIGREADITVLQERLHKAEGGMEGLWDEERGFYYNRRTDTGAFSRRISPTNFYALFAPSVPHERLRRIADEHYYNAEEFYGDWMLPSIARNDPAYADQNYWRGRVWAPLNFLVYLALRRTDLDDVRKDLAAKSRAMFDKEWQEHRHVHENYNSITGEGCDVANSDKFYHWGALLPVITLAEAGYLPDLGTPLQGGEWK